MTAIAVEEPVSTTAPAKTRPESDQGAKPKKQPLYSVVLHNDHVNGFDHVIRSLCKVFRFSPTKAFVLTFQAHEAGKSLVWTGMREHAELKADQLRDCGPDPMTMMVMARDARPLRVTIEPQPA